MNFQRARFNMVEQQIRTWDVLDQRVLDIIRDIPREDYVPEAYRNLAYADTSIPLEDGEVMMPPRVEARLLQALQLKPDDRVLEVGTGSGYLTALLAQLAGRVVSVEISETLAARARRALEAH
ncbi:MAG: protein-L-isoaspartate O-methyltransferase, partial [Gammaproteobacteria bacterium]